MPKHTSTTLLTVAIALALAACGGADAPAEGHAASPETEHASSSAGLPKGDAAAGKTLASTRGASGQSCVDCHGADGNNPLDPTYPKLGGQYHDYLEHALQAYRSGDRGGSVTSDLMANQAKALSDQQIADLSAYFGGVPGQLRDLHGAN
ncbi:MAG: cytochrome c [Pseudomonadota bacterium]